MTDYLESAAALQARCSVPVDTVDPVKLGAALAELRAKSGKSMKEVSDVVGCSKNYICLAEQGRRTLCMDDLAKYLEACSTPKDFTGSPGRINNAEP